MSRTGGEKTRKKIFTAAERLFAEKGYDGTGIQDIALNAGINKALIYYHFKNKQDIIDSLFRATLDEMFSMQGDAESKIRAATGDAYIQERLSSIINYLDKKRKILKVMLMESLKETAKGHLSLFQCANMVIEKNINEVMTALKSTNKRINRNELLIHEFFTGFLPIVFFAIFKDKWAEFFKCGKEETLKLFLKVFKESHIRFG